MTETHTTDCLARADQVLAEELALQGLSTAFSGPADDPTETVPAWGMSVAAVLAAWLSDGTVACTCGLHR